MIRMFESLDFFLLICLFLSVESQQGQIPPPQNVSLQWISDFETQLTWAPPQQKNCRIDVFTINTVNETYIENSITQPWTYVTVMEGGFLQMNISSFCDGRRSEWSVFKVNYPDLVTNLQCYIHAPKQTNCSWTTAASQAQDLRFFYQLWNENFQQNEPPLLRECSSYQVIGNIRTGCNVEAGVDHTIEILINGTLNNMFARNTFRKKPFNDIRAPALNWTVIKTGDKFLISWIPPEIHSDWTFWINYTECKEKKYLHIKDKTSAELDVVPKCPYRMTIQAKTGTGETALSEEKYFDADTDPTALLYAAIIIPLMCAGLAVLLFVCCRKNKKYIFPKVPEPRDFLSDISDNNNKITVGKLYIPAEEENSCKITLVDDLQIN